MKLYRADNGHIFWGLDWSHTSILDIKCNVTRLKVDVEEVSDLFH